MPRAKKTARAVTAPEPTLAELILAQEKLFEKGKQAYTAGREIEDRVVAEMRKQPDVEVELPDGRVAKLVDQFVQQKKNTIWKPAGVQQFIVELSQPK